MFQVDILDWLVVHTQRDEPNARSFVDTMMKVCPQLGVKIDHPAIQKIRDDRTETYLNTIKNNVGPNVQIVVVIFPSARDDRYAAIKKLCCVDRPIPSQVLFVKSKMCYYHKLHYTVQNNSVKYLSFHYSTLITVL